jgi:hypothetical protein
VRVVHPSELMREAAVVLEPVRDDIVIIGAVAVQIALDGHQVALAATRDIDVALTLTPTRDIDAGVKTDAVHRVVARLEEIGLRRSDVPHEHSFTWVKGDLKVQLLRPFDPFPKGSANGLPVSNIIPELHAHRVAVAFDDTPDTFRFWAASAAALIGLKEAAFGRTRPGGEPVDRDFSDVAMLLEQLSGEIAEELRDPSPMRGRAVRAAQRLLSNAANEAAARELVKAGGHDTQRGAERAVQRAAQAFLRRIG